MISVYQDHNLDWFPRMRAMSLVSSDADGEQNEIRNLQEKLESTMKLVSNLSGQLTELKEQVGWTKMQHWQRHHGGKHDEWVASISKDVGQQTLLEVCLFAVHCPLDAELTKCKRWWVIVHNAAYEALNLFMFAPLSNDRSGVNYWPVG